MKHPRIRAVVLLSGLCAGLLMAVGRPNPPKTSVDLIVAGGTVVTMDARKTLIENGAVVIKGDRILAVEKESDGRQKYEAKQTLDARGQLVIPGLINTHGHAPMVLFRGIADDLKLMDWLNQYIFPAEKKNVDEAFVRWGTKLACVEMLKSGTTTYVDMYYFEEEIARAAIESGAST